MIVKTQPVAKKDTPEIEKFIAGAPDAGAGQGDKPAAKHVKKGRKIQITHTLFLERLQDLDAMAASVGNTRAGLINLAINQLLERGVQVGGAGEGGQ